MAHSFYFANHINSKRQHAVPSKLLDVFSKVAAFIVVSMNPILHHQTLSYPRGNYCLVAASFARLSARYLATASSLSCFSAYISGTSRPTRRADRLTISSPESVLSRPASKAHKCYQRDKKSVSQWTTTLEEIHRFANEKTRTRCSWTLCNKVK